MITTLRIKDFAIIDQLMIDLNDGFSVFSGETGAGKSILITALSLLLGSRAYTEYIRSGKDSATVEGVFKVREISSAFAYLEEKGIDLLEGGEILIKRKIYRSEKSNRCYINHQPCSLSLLSEVGRWLVDLHGQHQHQLLLSPERHIDILDAFGNLKKLRDQFGRLYEEYEQKRKRFSALVRKKLANEDERELLRFQMQEIDQANLSPAEEEKLEARRRKLQMAERLFQDSTLVIQELYESEGSLHERLSKVCGLIRQLSRIDDFFSPLTDSLENVCYQIEEVTSQCTEYMRGIEFEPHLLDDVEARLAEIQKLKRKYGNTIREILDKRVSMEEEWLAMYSADDEIDKLQKQIEQLAATVLKMAENLSNQRQQTASIIEQRIKKELADLSLPRARFKVKRGRRQTPKPNNTSKNPDRVFAFNMTSKGFDLVEFLFSANHGEELKSLARIASGGEISRLMLALKACLKSADEVPVLVFDEVDVGIGGDVSRIVGRKLKELSTLKQVLCITHSPQIASLADHHYMVKKLTEANRTAAVVEQLDARQRVEELARMLGGGVASDITFIHARKLIETGEP